MYYIKKGQKIYELKFRRRFFQKRSQNYLKYLNYSFKLAGMHEECLPEKAPEMLRLFPTIGRFLLFNKNTDRHYIRHTAFCFQSHLIFKFIFLVFHTKNTASPSFMSLSRLCVKPLRESLF